MQVGWWIIGAGLLGVLASRWMAGACCPWHRTPRAGSPCHPEPLQLGQRARGPRRAAGQPGVARGVGMEVVGLDGQPDRVEPVVGVGRVDDLREARGPRHGQDGVVLGRLGRPADAGDQHPDDRHAPRRQSAAMVR